MSPKIIEREFPYIVEIAVPPRGLDPGLEGLVEGDALACPLLWTNDRLMNSPRANEHA